MIKGKFYAGLPSEMMTRGRTVNRQQTNFFWPDETDAESVTSRSKRTVSKPVTTNNNNAIQITQSDIKPKELVRKQLSSGIEFYDNVNAKTPEARRRRFKKIDNINLNNNNDIDFQPEKKKLETFSSKIEFYDFEHENNAKNEKPMKSINVEEMRKDEIKPKNESQEMHKKRISFRNDEKMMEKTRSILKNSDDKKAAVEKVLVKPLPKRGLLPKNLSKSVENISKLAKNFIDTDDNEKPEKLSTIIKEVKSLNLSQERSNRKANDYDKNERDSYHHGSNRIESRRNNDYGHFYSDKYEIKGYRDEEYRYRNDERNRNERYNDDYDDRVDRGYDERHYERSQRNTYSQPRDTYEYRQPTRRPEESPIRGKRSPNYDRYGDHYEREPRRAPIRESKPVPRKSDLYYDEAPVRSVRHEEDEYSTCISRKPKHIPQHLRSNILFSGKVGPQAQRPMSVRNSAVTRVGVGLPDIE